MVPALRVYGPREGYHLSTMTHQVPLRDVTKRGPQPRLGFLEEEREYETL